MQGFFLNLRIDHGENSEAAAQRPLYDSTRQRHDAAEIHPEMCTEQQLQSW